MNQYTHRYSLTAADMDTRYRMTPNAVLLYLPNETDESVYHYLHTSVKTFQYIRLVSRNPCILPPISPLAIIQDQPQIPDHYIPQRRTIFVRL